MKMSLITVAAASMFAAATVPASAETLWDLEAARANARAGGPVSAHDHYLLDRYGALSGTLGYSPGGTYRLKGYGHRSYRGWRKRRR